MVGHISIKENPAEIIQATKMDMTKEKMTKDGSPELFWKKFDKIYKEIDEEEEAAKKSDESIGTIKLDDRLRAFMEDENVKRYACKFLNEFNNIYPASERGNPQEAIQVNAGFLSILSEFHRLSYDVVLKYLTEEEKQESYVISYACTYITKKCIFIAGIQHSDTVFKIAHHMDALTRMRLDGQDREELEKENSSQDDEAKNSKLVKEVLANQKVAKKYTDIVSRLRNKENISDKDVEELSILVESEFSHWPDNKKMLAIGLLWVTCDSLMSMYEKKDAKK